MKRPIAFSLGVLVVFLALGAIGYFIFFPPAILQPSLTTQRFQQLDEIRRAANRDLENQAQLDVGAGAPMPPEQVAAEQVKKLSEMARPFETLDEALAEEPIGRRNQAVLWMLAQMPNGVNRQGLTDADAKLLDDRAAAAIASLTSTQPNEPASYLLAALYALRKLERSRANRELSQQLKEEAIAALQKALDIDPTQIEAAYQLGVLLDSDRSAPPPKVAVEAFSKAFKSRPGNFYVLIRQLNSLVRTHDPDTAEACRKAKSQCECVRRRILRENDPESDLIVLLDRAANAADAGNWEEAADALQIFDSWLTAIAADLGDLPEVTPHPLDYMLFDFSPALRDQFPVTRTAEKAIPIMFDAVFADEPQLSSIPKAIRLLDFDLDGKLELAVLEATQLQLFRRDEAGFWKPNSDSSCEGARGMAWGDLDRDESPQIKNDYRADLDLMIYGEQGITVYANEVDSTSQERALKPISTPLTTAVEHAVLIDFDHDGDLDIVAAIPGSFSLHSNLGNGQFEDVTAYSSLPQTEAEPARKLVVVDFDRDGDLDVLTTCIGRKEAGYLDNTRHGQMRWRALPQGFGDLLYAKRLFVAELDGNGSWDLVLHTEEGVIVLLTEQTAEGEIRLKQRNLFPVMNAELAGVGDFDNDGRIDAFVFGGLGGAIWRGDGAGGFDMENAVAVIPPGQFGPFLAVDIDDIDQDGDLDFALADFNDTKQMNGKIDPSLGERAPIGSAINQGGNANNWVTIRPRGADDNVSGKVNHYGLGTLVEIQAGPVYQAAVSDRPNVHFGLGGAKSADQIRVVFTNGFPQSVLESRLAGNQFIVEEMALKGSCPYVYTDRGNGWEFYSDCLWGAPIGMQYAEAKLQPGRPWEYLKLPGELLREREGAYRIKFTEELWEATYVDHVSLIAVDHPSSVEIFTNEKVGPPSIAENRLFTVSQRKAPLSAKDLKGRDLAGILAKADGDFTQCWDKSYRQGLVERHGLELDLGAFDPNAGVVLYLTGWIMPTDTSLNVAITQDPSLEGPRAPSLSVFDSMGMPQEIFPMLGFPGGKTKTIAIDLTGKFLSNDHRVVIATTHQIYWDEAFFTINEPAVEIETQVLPLLSAQMTYHGFSKKRPPLPRSPSMFDAAEIDLAPRWLPMRGGFTPFGDALGLLTQADDKMAIIGGGDGIELSFQAASPPKEGWTRDFILHSVGWDKDADLNTFFGQSVGPMPVGPDGGYLGPAVIGKPGEEGARIQPRSRFWKRLVHEADAK
jgi:tetratricopeptide (TPR) repeat protein